MPSTGMPSSTASVDEPELDPVAARLGRVQLGIGLGAVQAGLDIRAA